jgi:hypothetical protein
MVLQAELDDIIRKLSRVRAQLTGKLKESQELQNQITLTRGKIRTVSFIQKEVERLQIIFDQAKKALRKLTPTQLDEIARYGNPPKAVKLVVEAVLYLLVGKRLEWEQIRTSMINIDFIKKVLQFDQSSVKPHIIEIIKNDYFLSPDWNIEKIRKASQVAGPLAEWLEMQIGLIKALKQVTSARGEVFNLRDQQRRLEAKEADIEGEILHLEEEMGDLERKKTRITENQSGQIFEDQAPQDDDMEDLKRIHFENLQTQLRENSRVTSRVGGRNTSLSKNVSLNPLDGSLNETELRELALSLTEQTPEELYYEFKKHSTILKQLKVEADLKNHKKSGNFKKIVKDSLDEGDRNMSQLRRGIDSEIEETSEQNGLSFDIRDDSPSIIKFKKISNEFEKIIGDESPHTKHTVKAKFNEDYIVMQTPNNHGIQKSERNTDKLSKESPQNGGPILAGYKGLSPSPTRADLVTKVSYFKNNQPLRVTKSAELSQNSDQERTAFQEYKPIQRLQEVKVATKIEGNDSLRTIFQKSYQNTFGNAPVLLIQHQAQATAYGIPYNYPNIKPVRTNQLQGSGFLQEQAPDYSKSNHQQFSKEVQLQQPIQKSPVLKRDYSAEVISSNKMAIARIKFP